MTNAAAKSRTFLVDSNDDEERIRQVINSYADRLRIADVEGILELFSDDAIVMAPGMATAVGRERLHELYAGALDAAAIDFEFDFGRLEVRGETAIATTETTGKTTVRATSEEVPGGFRELFVLGRDGDAWKITQYAFQPQPGDEPSAPRREQRSYLVYRGEEGRKARNIPHVFKAAGSETGGRFDFIACSFAPRSGPPLHVHDQQDDSLFVLEGVLTVQVEDEIFDIGPGDFVSVPPRTRHTFDNLHNGEAPVRAINLMTPGGHLEMFEAWADIPAGSDHQRRMQQVAARFGTVFVGPPLRDSLATSD
jgi:uncharacterized protein (TIGR02246 family)